MVFSFSENRIQHPLIQKRNGIKMLNIRQMRITDYENVYRLWKSTPGMGLNTIDDSREGIANYLNRNPTTSFVAEETGEIVGAILAGHDGRRGYIYHAAVSMKFRKRGIGTKLVGSVMESLEKEGIHKAALVVFSSNENGNIFWEKNGFIERTDLVYRNKNLTELPRINP